MNDHLNALVTRLENEQARLDAAKTDRERASRMIIVASCRKELKNMTDYLFGVVDITLSDDDLLAELLA